MNFDWNFGWFDLPAYKKFLSALPTFNHQHLEEFCIKVNDREEDYELREELLASLIRELMGYLEKCPNLKILKFEFTETKFDDDDDDLYDDGISYRRLNWLAEEDIFEFRLQNLQELHVNGFCIPDVGQLQEFRNIFSMFQRNFPKLQRLGLKLSNMADSLDPTRTHDAVEREQIIQKFASERNVKIEITGTPEFRRNVKMVAPSTDFKIYNPIPNQTYQNQEETPVIKILRNRTICIMEKSKKDGPVAAKRRLTGNLDSQILKNFKPLKPHEQIFQEKQRIIENIENLQVSRLNLQLELEAQIIKNKKFEDKLKELMGPLLETMLSDEILLKIFGYLSSYDILRNVAQVSKRFQKLSENPFLIRKIELHHFGYWGAKSTGDQIRGLLKVLKISKNLRFFSFDLDWKFDWSFLPAYKDLLSALSTFDSAFDHAFDHQHLEEFCIKAEDSLDDSSWEDKASLIRKWMEYLEKCPNLKILTFEFTRTKHDDDYWYDDDYITYRKLNWLEKQDIFEFRLQNLEELHINGFDYDYKEDEEEDLHEFRSLFYMFRRNFPKLRRLCLKLNHMEEFIDPFWTDTAIERDQILQKFASDRNVMIEVTGTPEFRRLVKEVAPSTEFRIYNPIRK